MGQKGALCGLERVLSWPEKFIVGLKKHLKKQEHFKPAQEPLIPKEAPLRPKEDPFTPTKNHLMLERGPS